MTISIKPTASGSTIEQDGSTILTVDGSGNLTVANNLSVTGTAPSIDALSTATGSAPSYSARAWVNFNGTGTVAIRASGNVSSITDNGVGDYTVNFSTAMVDANYCGVVSAKEDESGTSAQLAFGNPYRTAQTTSSFRILCATSGSKYDHIGVFASFFR